MMRGKSSVGMIYAALAGLAGRGVKFPDYELYDDIVPSPKHINKSKYQPHQGKKECERRIKQVNKRAIDVWGVYTPAPLTKEIFEQEYLLTPEPILASDNTPTLSERMEAAARKHKELQS